MAAWDQNISDDALMEAVIAAQDHEAFAQIVLRHYAKVFNLAWQITRQRELAEDVVQESCMRAWRYASSYRKTGSVRNWFLRIAARESLRQLMRNPSKDPSLEDINNVADSESGTPMDLATQNEAHTALREGLLELPRIHRLVMVLYYGAGMNQKEIGEELGITQQAVSFRMQDSLQKLRAYLGTAGFAATAPLCSPESLAGAVVGDLQPDPKLLDTLVRKRPWADAEGTNLSAPGISRRSSCNHAAASKGLLTLPAILTVLAAGAILSAALLWPSSEVINVPDVSAGPNRVGEGRAETETPVASPSALTDEAIYFEWDCAAPVLDGIEVLQGELTWKVDESGNAGGRMLVPKEITVWVLPEIPGPRAYQLKATATPGKGFTIGAEWTEGGRRLWSRIYFSLQPKDPLVRGRAQMFDWILVDDFLVLQVNGEIVKFIEYKPKARVPHRILMNGSDLLLSRLVLRSLSDNERDEWRAKVKALARETPVPQPYMNYEPDHAADSQPK